MDRLKLKIISINGIEAELECDSVRITLNEGEHSGSYGIRKGHANSVFALGVGHIEAFTDNNQLLFAKTGNGFATVDNNNVLVTVDSFEK